MKNIKKVYTTSDNLNWSCVGHSHGTHMAHNMAHTWYTHGTHTCYTHGTQMVQTHGTHMVQTHGTHAWYTHMVFTTT